MGHCCLSFASLHNELPATSMKPMKYELLSYLFVPGQYSVDREARIGMMALEPVPLKNE